MAIQFNHTILYAHDSEASAKFLAEMLGLSAPARWGPFVVVKTDNGTNLDFMDTDGEITSQHYAFLVEESDLRADSCAKASLLGRSRSDAAEPNQSS